MGTLMHWLNHHLHWVVMFTCIHHCIDTYFVLFQPSHPHPGEGYQGISITACLQDDDEGRKVMLLCNALCCILEYEGKQNTSQYIQRSVLLWPEGRIKMWIINGNLRQGRPIVYMYVITMLCREYFRAWRETENHQPVTNNIACFDIWVRQE